MCCSKKYYDTFPHWSEKSKCLCRLILVGSVHGGLTPVFSQGLHGGEGRRSSHPEAASIMIALKTHMKEAYCSAQLACPISSPPTMGICTPLLSGVDSLHHKSLLLFLVFIKRKEASNRTFLGNTQNFPSFTCSSTCRELSPL